MKKSRRWISVFTSALLLSLCLTLSSCSELPGGDTSSPGIQEEISAGSIPSEETSSPSSVPEAEPAGNGTNEEAANRGSGGEPATDASEESGGESAGTAEESLSSEKLEEIVHSFEEGVFVPDIVYSGSPYLVLNNNIPFFTKENLPAESFEYYSDLDGLGRCGIACANIGKDIMPEEERGNIGQIKPSGWHTVKCDIIDGIYLYNRCHLIAYELSGENANEKNLITGTRYMNIAGMLPFENKVADYVKETDNHVLYRVAPVYAAEDDLLAYGVIMEGWSVEDDGEGICYNVFVFNVQPGIRIDYATGESGLAETGSAPDSGGGTPDASQNPVGGNPQSPGYPPDSTGGTTQIPDASQNPADGTTQTPDASQNPADEDSQDGNDTDGDQADAPRGTTYILNTNTKKFHYPDCSSVKQMAEKNKWEYTGSREDVVSMGYDACKRCKP